MTDNQKSFLYRRIYQMLREDKSNQEIADALGISYNHASNLISHVYKDFDVHDRHEFKRKAQYGPFDTE